MIFDLGLVKQHLRDPAAEEEEYIKSLCLAAEQTFNHHTGRRLYAADADLSEQPANAIALSEEIQQGALVLIAWLYGNREGEVSGNRLPLPTRLLWGPHRWPNV